MPSIIHFTRVPEEIGKYLSQMSACRAELLQFRHAWKFMTPQLSLYEWKKLLLEVTSKKESRTDKSVDLEGQWMSPTREMSRPGNCCRNLFILILAMWAVAPSCWNHVVSRRSISLNSGMRKVFSMWIYRSEVLPWGFSKKCGPIIPNLATPHHTVTLGLCNGVSWSNWRLVSDQHQ